MRTLKNVRDCRPGVLGLQILPAENERLHDRIERITEIAGTAVFAGQDCRDLRGC